MLKSKVFVMFRGFAFSAFFLYCAGLLLILAYHLQVVFATGTPGKLLHEQNYFNTIDPFFQDRRRWGLFAAFFNK